MGGFTDPTLIISLLKVWSITYKLYTAQAKNFMPVLSGHPPERAHDLHTDQGGTPILTSLLLKRNVALNSCSRALKLLSPYEDQMTTVSLFALNTCALRYCCGFYRASKTAHLVQGTQVSSDAGHNNVHWCPTPTAVNKHDGDELTNSRVRKTKENELERAVTWRSDWRSDQSRHAWSCWSRLQWQPLELLRLRQCLLWLRSYHILGEQLESADCKSC